MIKNIIYVTIFFLLAWPILGSSATENCLIESYPRILISDSLRPKMELIKSSSCPQIVNKTFVEILEKMNGKINSTQLPPMILSEVNNVQYNIQIIPLHITINNLESFLREKIELPFDIKTSDIKLIGSRSSISLSANDIVSFECPQCSELGQQNIKIIVSNPITEKEQIFWASTVLLKSTAVLELKESTNAFNKELVPSMFLNQQKGVENPGIYFTDLNKLQFYKTNKPLKKGHLLKHSDLSPITLVKAGERTKLEIRHGNLKLDAVGVARKNGALGEMIELINPKTKKYIMGKVINFNTVSILL